MKYTLHMIICVCPWQSFRESTRWILFYLFSPTLRKNWFSSVQTRFCVINAAPNDPSRVKGHAIRSHTCEERAALLCCSRSFSVRLNEKRCSKSTRVSSGCPKKWDTVIIILKVYLHTYTKRYFHSGKSRKVKRTLCFLPQLFGLNYVIIGHTQSAQGYSKSIRMF